MIRSLPLKSFNAINSLVSRTINIECDGIPYQFQNVPLKKILNWILVEASISINSKAPWGWPTHLQIEPTSMCNLKCTLCPVTEGMDRPGEHLDLNVFKNLIDEIGDYVLLALMWDWGEPFVNPSVIDMISYAKEKGIKVISSTNGHLFARQEYADKLILSGIDSIIVAMDGVTQATYERYRQSGKLETVLDGVRTLVARKRELKSRTPLINLRFLVMTHNEHEIPELKKLANSLGVDVLSIKTLNPYSNDTYFENRVARKEFYEAYLPEHAQYRRFKYSGNGENMRRIRRHPPCKNLWNAATIHSNGIVCPCTYDYNEMYILGDLKMNSFKDIWFGEPYRSMRRQFRSNWEELQLCRNCSYAYEGGSCWNETIAEVFFDPKLGKMFSRPDVPDRVKSLD